MLYLSLSTFLSLSLFISLSTLLFLFWKSIFCHQKMFLLKTKVWGVFLFEQDIFKVPRDFVSFFVCDMKKLIACCCISAKKNDYSLTNNGRRFQASVTERSTSLSKSCGIFRQISSKVPVKKLNLQKNFTRHELLHKWFLRFPVRFFHLFTEACLYLIQLTYFVFVFIFVKGISSHFYYS